MARFSIIITCYNQKAIIQEAVNSALSQRHADKEIIVVDDASSDGSREVLEAYGGAITLKALPKNGGGCAARNCGASVATGDFLVYLDGDDLLFPWALAVFNQIVISKRPKLILCRMIQFNSSPFSLNWTDFPREIKVVEYAAYVKKDRPYRTSASTMVIERHSLAEVGGWTVGVWPMEDADLLLKLGYVGRTIQILSPQTTAYRLHAENFSRQVQKLVGGACALIQREKSGAYPGGPAGRSARYAIIGGVALWWLRRAVKMRLYGQGLKLVSSGWLMILTAIFRKVGGVCGGRRPVENLEIVS